MVGRWKATLEDAVLVVVTGGGDRRGQLQAGVAALSGVAVTTALVSYVCMPDMRRGVPVGVAGGGTWIGAALRLAERAPLWLAAVIGKADTPGAWFYGSGLSPDALRIHVGAHGDLL